MLENLVAWVLNNYIGEYLENLNTDQLSVAFLSGQVELENVPLKKTALRMLDLPLEVKSGLLGKLTLTVPITHIRSEPWTLKLSDVLIVVGPLPPSRRYDVEVVEQVQQQKKEQMLEELETRHKSDLLSAMRKSSPPSQDSWWGASLVSTVLNNIQLILNNVHIRYEDNLTLLGNRSFSCGIRIQKMTMQTTNSKWKPGFVEPQDGLNVFKKLELSGFSIYWNSDETVSGKDYTPKELRDLLAPETHSNSFIIHPCSLELLMERNTSKFPLKGSQPRFKFFLSPNKLTCELTRRQMSELRALNREWARFERARQHRKWRPLSTVSQSTREWWLFAYGRVVDESRKSQSRRTWHFALTRARHLNAYCRAYRRRLLGLIHNPDASDSVADPGAHSSSTTPAGVSLEDRTIMKQIERDSQYTYHELQLFRETVFRRLQKELEMEYSTGSNEEPFETLNTPVDETLTNPVETMKDEGKGLYGWITSFFSAEDSNNVNDDRIPDFAKIDLSDLKNLPKSFSLKEMEDEILDVLHETWDDSTLLRRDGLLAEIALRLDQITLRFIDSNTILGVEQRRVLAMDLTKVSSRVELSPRQSSLSVQLSVGDMSIQRLRTGHGPPSRRSDGGIDETLMYSLAETTKILLAIGRKNSDESLQNDPIFRMHYRRSSPRVIVRHVIEGSFKPISVMYEENAMAGLSTLFADDQLMFKSDGHWDVNQETYSTESHILVNILIPDVTMELRHSGWLNKGLPEWEVGEPLVCMNITDILFGVSSKELHMSQLKIDIGHFECNDLMHKSSYPLMVSGKTLKKQSEPLSSSCPNLVQLAKTDLGTTSSLPTSTFLDKLPGLGHNRRKISAIESRHREIQVLLTLVDSRHRQFETKYKTNCNVEVMMNDLSMGMNRSTLTALMDLAGFLGSEESKQNNCPDELTEPSQPYTIGCGFRSKVLIMNMCYPDNNTQLGNIILQNPEFLTMIKLNEPQETISVDITMEGMKIDDRTPDYSEIYEERLIFQSHRPIPDLMEIHIVKYLGENPNRECDVNLNFIVPESMNLFYVHTHRFFCGLMDFWMQFFELQDQVAKSKKERVIEGGRSKVLLDVLVKSPTVIILPMNQCSDQVLILESTGINFNNTLKRFHTLEEVFQSNFVETDYGFDSSVDCLLDCGTIVLKNLSAFEGLHHDLSTKRPDTNARVIGQHFFTKCDYYASFENVFDKKFDLTFDVYRNLDGTFSHNAPDLTVITSITNLIWNMTTDFYVLFRGVLEKNFGDPLITVPETVPMEILQKPEHGCELGSDFKYATLSFRMLFNNVTLELKVPNPARPTGLLFGKCFRDFGRMELCSAQISFDVFIDGQSELDLICESTKLIDTRAVQQGNGERNLFPVILQPRENTGCSGQKGLMSEAHLMMKKDEPPIVTLVLMNARVLLLSDWLNDAKDFALLASDFVPKYYDDASKYHPHKKGVIGRTKLEAALSGPDQTFSVKITLRESDLYLLEVPSKKNCLALVASTTAVLNMNDSGGDIEANLEIQSVTLGWCSMQHGDSSLNLCSNDFSVGIGVSVERLMKPNNGLPQLSVKKHFAEIDVRGVIGRMAYKDYRVITTVLEGFQKHVLENFGKTMIPSIGIKKPGNPLQLDKIIFKTEHADIWILDDYQGSSIPFLRLSFSKVEVEHQTERLVANLIMSADYFNQKVFGWEPFVEKWKITRFLLDKREKSQRIELIAESRTTLDINVTEQLVQQVMQMSARLPAIQASLEKEEYRNSFMKTRTDHLPYLFKNETGSDIVFTTAVDDILTARHEQRKPNVKWITVQKGKEQTFEFPTKLLLYSQNQREPPRQLIIRVSGWDEISQVNVDTCGTYFRVVKATKTSLPNARLVIRVTMEKDGKKVVAVRSSLEVYNQLPHPINVYSESHTKPILTVGIDESLPIPLEHAHSSFSIVPASGQEQKARAEITWKSVRIAGQVLNTTQRLDGMMKGSYWLCTMVRREYYPEDENLPGHSVYIIPPLTVQNLLPIDAEIRVADQVFAIGAGKLLQITTVDITADIKFVICTDRMRGSHSISISKSTIGEGQQLHMRLKDGNDRFLDMYANLKIGFGGSVSMSLWVPYWIVNKSGIPLVIKQEAANHESAGQGDEHEKAKDKHPLMFSFSDDGCPHQCVVRVGGSFITEPGYQPMYGKRFPLTPGVQAMKLRLIHDTLPTLYYNVGVEVRAGTGRYKDTQVVLLTSRYVLNNQSSYKISVCHSGEGMMEQMSNYVHIAAQCSLVWNEKVEGELIRVRRSDVRHWSCPFRIDRIGSFHITMRDGDETPRFIRVEIILSSAAFCVTFTDAEYFPPPIRIDNQSDVPVLYQQHSANLVGSHLRTICKAKSHVDYAWDDLYGTKLIVLQVYENKSHEYDPACPGIDKKTLVYENHTFFQLVSSFEKGYNSRMTEECELVLETLLRGKVTLNKQNRIDGNSGNQLWKLCSDGCIENIGISNRMNERMVLDVLDSNGYQLMMGKYNPSRDKYQKWTFMPSGQLCLQALPRLFVTARKTEVCLEENDPNSPLNEDCVPVSQVWKLSRQRAGSGKLEVECLHSGPTLVVRITDKEKKRALSLPSTQMQTPGAWEISVSLRSGIGISVVNGLYEELLYARLSGIDATAKRINDSYRLNASVGFIQVDNQLIGAEKVPVIFCQAEYSSEDDLLNENLPTGVPYTINPALRLEMNCTPMKNYDAFDCFRLKLCDVNFNLNELIMWKLVQFVQASDVASSVQQKALSLPPNLEIDRPDPLRTRRWYFGTLELVMGQIALSVTTVPKSSLPVECKNLRQQFNVKLVSFENATVSLPPFRQSHYFETSMFLVESLQKFYFAELQKQTLNIVVTLDAFGNPLGLVTDLKDSFQGLFIEGDVQRFVAGLGYGVSNSISKMASSMASGVGSLTFDQAHELRRRNNMIRSQSSSSTPLTHLYSGVKGLGMGVFGGVTAILTNTITESRKSGIVSGTLRGLTTGAVDTVTKPVQGLFDLVEGTASAMKELAGPAASGSRRAVIYERIRPPRVCRDLFHLLPPYDFKLANCQLEMLRINGYSMKERLLDVETCLEQLEGDRRVVRQYVLISTKQSYVCKQVNGESSSVIQRIAYKYLRSVQPIPELKNSCAAIDIRSDNNHEQKIWCSSELVARRLADKITRAKHEYDHSKRTLNEHNNYTI